MAKQQWLKFMEVIFNFLVFDATLLNLNKALIYSVKGW